MRYLRGVDCATTSVAVVMDWSQVSSAYTSSVLVTREERRNLLQWDLDDTEVRPVLKQRKKKKQRPLEGPEVFNEAPRDILVSLNTEGSLEAKAYDWLDKFISPVKPSNVRVQNLHL